MKIAVHDSIFRLIGWIAHMHRATDCGGEKPMIIDAASYLMGHTMLILDKAPSMNESHRACGAIILWDNSANIIAPALFLLYSYTDSVHPEIGKFG